MEEINLDPLAVQDLAQEYVDNGFSGQLEEHQDISPPLKSDKKNISVHNTSLTEEQREMYESILRNWKPKVVTKFICMRCNKRFIKYQNFYLHNKRVHPSDKDEIVCDICNKSFNCKQSHYWHMVNKHRSDEEKFYCKFCPKELRSSRALHMHMKRFHPKLLPEIKCSECGKQFKTPYKLKNHTEMSHRDDREKFICNLCEKVYKNRKTFISHFRFQHTTIEEHSCVFCPMTFKSRSRLKDHILNIHPPVETKVQCPQCALELKNNKYLKKHIMLMHLVGTDKSKYEHECEQCGKKFKIRRYLNKHLQSHEKQRKRREFQMRKRSWAMKINQKIGVCSPKSSPEKSIKYETDSISELIEN